MSDLERIQFSILVVEDNELNRDLLRRRLERSGYLVTAASDGARALELLRVEKFDAVLLDIMMPEVDGMAVLEEIQSEPKLRQIPVMMVTAVNDAERVARCIRMGAKDYITKPYEGTLLAARLWRLLQRSPRVCQAPGLGLVSDFPATCRILVVDDNALTRDLLRDRLTAAGYELDCTDSGSDAVRRLEQNAYAAVLLDIMMPGMDGREVLAVLNEKSLIKRTQVVMLTAVDDTESMRRCFELGAVDFITKPFNWVLLKARIESIVQVPRS